MEMMPKMIDYVIQNFYKDIYKKYGENKAQMYYEFYKELCDRTIKMVAMWQCYGFCHGVLNTDNMSIMGITIDYGPYAFMDHFNP